ncbi:MAG: ketoacyl-ACP synthase III [Kofleriaceae bacterium]|nr:ketoacyl-ACP synthase III [Myxococcales bacterium]MCB9559749.1 ketoacyl-ACP synthase III [Kofleriaceae bacterium]MCB9572947.1 ketoacyl-ACP synthase III [Kofleriaceae bacterium]
MIRTAVLGLGSYVPDRVVTNDDLRHMDSKHVLQEEVLTETNDAWIQQRTGIRERRYVPNDGSVGTSDLALEASKRALADAGVDAKDVDCIILGTLSPDIHFPGTAVFLQDKLGIAGEGKGTSCACYDIRQQCSGFVYGLQMADAFIKAGMYKRVLLVGAETHSHSLDFSTRGRDVMVLFGDGAAAVVLGPQETDDARAGVLYTDCRADGSGAWNLYLKIFDIKKAPYLGYDTRDPEFYKDVHPQMDGKRVFLHAVRNMVVSSQQALARSGLTWDDIDWFVPHQANLRINEKVVEVAGIPPEKVLNTIQFYGNTTAATVPLTIDHWRKEGKVKKGDRVLATVFGAGFTWGSAIFQV